MSIFKEKKTEENIIETKNTENIGFWIIEKALKVPNVK